MPNHIHAIMWITEKNGHVVKTISDDVETIHESSLHNQKSLSRKQRRQMLLPKIIGRFKMQTAKKINQIQKTSGQAFWQKNYYERIISNQTELNNIRIYIINNPFNPKMRKIIQNTK